MQPVEVAEQAGAQDDVGFRQGHGALEALADPDLVEAPARIKHAYLLCGEGYRQRAAYHKAC
jgi:hypothetical protein